MNVFFTICEKVKKILISPLSGCMTQNLHIDHLILKQAFKTAFLIEHLKVMLQWL